MGGYSIRADILYGARCSPIEYSMPWALSCSLRILSSYRPVSIFRPLLEHASEIWGPKLGVYTGWARMLRFRLLLLFDIVNSSIGPTLAPDAFLCLNRATPDTVSGYSVRSGTPATNQGLVQSQISARLLNPSFRPYPPWRSNGALPKQP